MSIETHNTAPKKTPLFDEHINAGAKMVDFGGWFMPVQYTTIMDEHHAVRTALGVFDISHMGELFVSGPTAKEWLNYLLTNAINRLRPGECQYTFLLNEHGGVIDDLIAYQLAENEYLLVVNASKIDEDFAWMREKLRPGVTLENRSDEFAGLAIQGPSAMAFFDRFFGPNPPSFARNQIRAIDLLETRFLAARTGYTGEEGFELFFPAANAPKAWNEILSVGANFGIKPCGLGARDTLRLEMCYPLNGSDLSPSHTPIEAGMGFFIDFDKPDFIGREALSEQRLKGIKRRLVPFRMRGKSPPPRSHYGIYKNGALIGEASSGSLSPSLGTGIGMAYLPEEFARIDEEIDIDIRGRRFPAVVAKKPLYRKPSI